LTPHTFSNFFNGQLHSSAHNAIAARQSFDEFACTDFACTSTKGDGFDHPLAVKDEQFR
jgi:hypothetical protein